MRSSSGLVSLLVFGLASLTHGDASGGFLGCGGFVRSPFQPFDWGRINVGLYTEHGSLKDTTDCAPSTGYFFIPVYEQAKYVLKVITPPGWQVTPAEVPLDIDGSGEDLCSQNLDINFNFVGYAVRGRVSTQEKERAPETITLGLYAVDSDAAALQTTTSDAQGAFAFSGGVAPGRYVVKVQPESLAIYSFERNSFPVTVEADNIDCEPFKIIGYDVEGSVVIGGGGGVAKVKMQLLEGERVLAGAVSDANGNYKFSNISRGSYTIRPTPSERGIDALRFEPQVIELNVEDKNIRADPFSLLHFSLSGRVKLPAGFSHEVTVSSSSQPGSPVRPDEQGRFTLTHVKTGQLEVSASADGVQFAPLNLNVKSPFAALPDLTVSKARASGKVELLGAAARKQLHVLFTSGQKKETARIGADGAFQVYLAPGTYQAAVVADDLKTPVKGYVSARTQLKMADTPTSGLDFLLTRAELSGLVKCLEANCRADSVRILVTAEDGTSTTTVLDEKNRFQMANLLPMKYTLAVQSEQFCWQKEQVQVDLKDRSEVSFQQTGYHVTVAASHATELVLTGEKSGQVQQFAISAGHNTVCVAGVEAVTATTKSCHDFKSLPLTLEARLNRWLELEAVGFEVSGKVLAKKGIKDLSLKVSMADSADATPQVRKLSDGTGYAFSLRASNQQQLTITPASSDFFFEPANIRLTVNNNCLKDAAVFQAKEGEFLLGQVTPAVEGVLISDDHFPQLETRTDRQGKFRLGPLADVSVLRLSASKDGYYFEKTSQGKEQGRFSSHQLASITVQALDEQKQPLPEVVISISGGSDNYRNNSQAKTGQVTFTSLKSGEYFIKPFMKEWVFAPKNHLLSVSEGDRKTVTLNGQRVAFSVLGQISHLNGDAEPGGMVVLARGRGQCQGHVEDALTTGRAGNFRLRGLKSGCEYDIVPGGAPAASASEAAGNGGGEVERLLGSEVTGIRIDNKDVQLKSRILAVRKADTMNLALLLKCPDSYGSKRVYATLTGSSTGNPQSLYLVPGRLSLVNQLPMRPDQNYTLSIPQFGQQVVFANDQSYKYLVVDVRPEAVGAGAGGNKESDVGVSYILPLAIMAGTVAVFVKTQQGKSN